mmetsp:Transcript_4775/g.8188  ORF Transcript_4775/g.8188 Transcript_4775/m.8188 type:complete len:186 (+) Transcript_4775:2310-2867(+)
MDDEEESKYDVSSFLAEAKRWRGKGGKFNFQRRPYNSISSSKALLAAGTSALRKIQLNNLGTTDSGVDSKTPVKKKNSINQKKSVTQNKGGDAFLSKPDKDMKQYRKNSMMVGNEGKGESAKKYNHQLIANGSQMLNITNTKLTTAKMSLHPNNNINYLSIAQNGAASNKLRRNTIATNLHQGEL